MRPLPEREDRSTQAKRRYTKHPSPLLTSDASLQFTKQRDKDFTPGDLGPKLAETPKRPRGRQPTPIPFRLPRPSVIVAKPDVKYRCSTCDEASEVDFLDEWVECNCCRMLTHLACLVSIGQVCLACNEPIYVKKTPKLPKTEMSKYMPDLPKCQ